MASAMRIHTPQVTFDVSAAGAFATMFAEAPGLVFAATRFGLQRMLAEHRAAWLQRTQVKFRAGGIRASPIDSRQAPGGGSFDARRTVFYKVFPDKIDRNAPPKTVPTLDKIRAEIFTTSPVALGLETGGTFRARGGYLALPVGPILDSLGRPKSRWNTPQRFTRFGHRTFVLPARSGSGKRIIWEQRKGRGQGATRTLQTVFRLVPQVTRVARFKLMDTWDGLGSRRGAILREQVEFIVKRLQPRRAG